MRKPASMKALKTLGRIRLSEHFFMREMLYSEIASFHGVPNIPDDPDLAIAAGTRLCEELLEPLHATSEKGRRSMEAAGGAGGWKGHRAVQRIARRPAGSRQRLLAAAAERVAEAPPASTSA